MKNANKHKNYITSDCNFIFNRYKTDTTYGQKIIDCPDEIYQQILNLNYRTNTRLFPNITCDTRFGKYITGIFEFYVQKTYDN